MNSKLAILSNDFIEKNRKQAAFAAIIILLSIVSLAFFVLPAKAASLTILSHRGYVTIIGTFYIWGEFQNTENVAIQCKQVTATLYDSSNNLIAEQNWTAGSPIVLPNQKMPFMVLVIKSDVDLNRTDHYTLSIETSPITTTYSTKTLLDIKVTSYNTSIDNIGYMKFAGEVENAANENASSTKVFVTCYDTQGNVVWTDWAFTEDSEILPGQKSYFETVSVPKDIVPQIANSTLVTQSYVITSISPTEPESPSDLDVGAEASVPPYVFAAWAPPAENAVAATAVTTVAVGVVSVAIAAGTRSAGASAGKVAEKAQGLVPDSVKKWLEEFMCSKRKETLEQKTRSPFLPTKTEAIAYAVSLVALTLSFSYAKVPDFSLILNVLPLVLITAVIVEFIKTYILEVFARSRGVWTEHKLWYFGLAMFLITTFAFGVPFSSPSRNVYHSEKLTKRLSGMIGAVSILVTLAFAGLFFGLLAGGFALIGSTGLAMCIIIALIDTFPMTPMNGKSVFDYSKALWAGLFGITAAAYVIWLLFF